MLTYCLKQKIIKLGYQHKKCLKETLKRFYNIIKDKPYIFFKLPIKQSNKPT